jgi:hypothetical protein
MHLLDYVADESIHSVTSRKEVTQLSNAIAYLDESTVSGWSAASTPS